MLQSTDSHASFCNRNKPNLTILLKGENSISSKEKGAMLLEESTYITGEGNLSISSDKGSAILLNKGNTTLTIQGCTVSAVGDSWGISGGDGKRNETLNIVNGARLRAKGFHGAIVDIAELKGDYVITKPEGAYFDRERHAVFDKEGNVAKGEVEIVSQGDSSSKQIALPVRVYAHKQNLYISLLQRKVIRIYSIEGSLLRVQALGPGDHCLSLPEGICIIQLGRQSLKTIQ
ncbi:hypothetical protein [Porphyromonas crevioricanis]|nr:hypothetical protein [Porphyromonas crevioricanis]